jgi:hypothetical protein
MAQRKIDVAEVEQGGRAGAALAQAGLPLAGFGVLLLVAAAIWASAAGEMPRFWFAYLLSVVFFVSIALGALFFVLVNHLTGAKWGIVLRRLAEVTAGAVGPMGLLLVPIGGLLLMGNHQLYEWNDAAHVAEDPLLQAKAPYLNATFFVLRGMAYVAIWAGLSQWLLRTSRRQDVEGGQEQRMRSVSAPAMIVFALTVNFAAFDWLMSLAPHWFSSIYGVYFFSGCVVGAIAWLIVLSAGLQSRGLLVQAVTADHYHDLGKLLFGFVFFWGYIAFSQYLLIWTANIPEETTWYALRQQGGWIAVSIVLLVGHLLVPFVGLLSRAVRRNKRVLTGWAVVLLAMHWLDLYYQVMPQLHNASLPLGLPEALCLAGCALLFAASLCRGAAGAHLLPIRDARLPASLAFVNH